ncbi:MAG: Mur ligase family protein [Balneolaceae bacterium]
MFQQFGYKLNEFGEWTSRSFFSRILTSEHVLINIIIAALLYLMSDRLTVSAAALILGIFIIFWFGPAARYMPDREKKPLVYTPRMTRLASVMSILVAFPFYMILDLSITGRLFNTILTIREAGQPLLLADPYFLIFGLVFVDMLIPLMLFLSAILLKPVEWWIQEGFKRKARKKLSRMPDLKVVAITGSYGKTSTKFMIATLLKERFSVCVTPGSYNTPMGICKVINNDLQAHHQILVLEMGARYEGNIRELCEIATPDVSVITNVGKAHLETFGSVEAIAAEKSTLATELKEEGTLVLNMDDEKVAAMKGLRPDATIIETGIRSGVIRAEEIIYDQEGIRFLMITGGRQKEEESKTEIRMNLLGRHNAENFLLAAGVAQSFGIRPGTIALGAKAIEPVEHRLELKKEGELIIIDDAFNSNPVGAKHAVEVLASFSGGRKIIVTPGMVELGAEQEEENRAFGKVIGMARLDLVILVGPEQTAPILEGVKESAGMGERVRVVNSLFEANDIIREYAQSGDIVLYENDLPDLYNE